MFQTSNKHKQNLAKMIKSTHF